jgi:predicted HTH domain antitoxin
MKKVEFIIPINTISETTQKVAENQAREAYIMTLVKFGEISTGRASKLLGISRLEVIELMPKYDISPFDDSMSLEEFQQEVKQAKSKLSTNNL